MLEFDWWKVVLSIVVAIITALIAKTQLVQVYNMAQRASMWVWRKICFPCTVLVRKWRRRQALTIVERSLRSQPGVSIRVPSDLFHRSIGTFPITARSLLCSDMKDRPSWLNDHYVCTALETLNAQGRVVKAKKYLLEPLVQPWPPKEYKYIFQHVDYITSQTVTDEAKQIETNSWCMIYQDVIASDDSQYGPCSVDARFEWECYPSITLGPNRTTRAMRVSHLKESAPPCQRCWERYDEERHLSQLVATLWENELWMDVTLLPGTFHQEIRAFRLSMSSKLKRGPFLTAVVADCMESGISHEAVNDVSKVTKQRITAFRVAHKTVEGLRSTMPKDGWQQVKWGDIGFAEWKCISKAGAFQIQALPNGQVRLQWMLNDTKEPTVLALYEVDGNAVRAVQVDYDGPETEVFRAALEGNLNPG